MEMSPLQKARYEYAPKLPQMLRGGIAEISVKEGAETKSVADCEKINALFPNTYGKKEIVFEKGANRSAKSASSCRADRLRADTTSSVVCTMR